jgi:hypothetical protein
MHNLLGSAMTDIRDSRPCLPGPPCPKCRSEFTTHAYIRFSERFFFCGDCDHRWSARAARLPHDREWQTGQAKPTTLSDLIFLTRDGCACEPRLVILLDSVLTALGWPLDYRFVEISTLSVSDARTGYPMPTILWKGNDIFGMPTPVPPYAAPS